MFKFLRLGGGGLVAENSVIMVISLVLDQFTASFLLQGAHDKHVGLK